MACCCRVPCDAHFYLRRSRAGLGLLRDVVVVVVVVLSDFSYLSSFCLHLYPCRRSSNRVCSCFTRGEGESTGGDLSLVGGGAEGYDELWLMVSPRADIERGYVGVVGKRHDEVAKIKSLFPLLIDVISSLVSMLVFGFLKKL